MTALVADTVKQQRRSRELTPTANQPVSEWHTSATHDMNFLSMHSTITQNAHQIKHSIHTGFVTPCCRLQHERHTLFKGQYMFCNIVDKPLLQAQIRPTSQSLQLQCCRYSFSKHSWPVSCTRTASRLGPISHPSHHPLLKAAYWSSLSCCTACRSSCAVLTAGWGACHTMKASRNRRKQAAQVWPKRRWDKHCW